MTIVADLAISIPDFSAFPRDLWSCNRLILYYIMKKSSNRGIGDLSIMPLYVTPSFQIYDSPRNDPERFYNHTKTNSTK